MVLLPVRRGPGHGQLDPVPDGGVLGLAHAKDIPGSNRLFQKNPVPFALRLARFPRQRRMKVLVVGTVLLRLLELMRSYIGLDAFP